MSVTKVLLSALIALATPSFMTLAVAQTQPTFQNVLDGARKEGKLFVWVSSPALPETHRALIQAFNARFNLKTEVEWVTAAAPTSTTRAIAEAAGGKISVDIIGAASFDEISVAANAKIIKSYPWTAVFGKELQGIGQREDLVLPEYRGMALPIHDAVYGIAWNPTLIKDEDVPKKLSEVATDPKWRGKIAWSSFSLIPLDIASLAVGPAETLALGKKLVENQPVYGRGSNAVANAVTVGTALIGGTLFHSAERGTRNNEPIKFKLFSDVIPISMSQIFVLENSPNPYTARLFAAWLSTEGVVIADKFESAPRAMDPETKVGKMIKDQIAATNAKIAVVRSVDDLNKATKMRDELSLLISGQK